MIAYLIPNLMLFISSSIIAWYGHLKFKIAPLWTVILISWGIAFFEYIFQVPANRLGHKVMNAAQLRVSAELFTLISFIFFSIFYLNEKFTLNYIISFILIFAAVYFAFWGPFKN